MALLGQTRAIAGSLGLRLEVNPGPREIDALLRRIAAGLRDFRPAWKRIAREVLLPAVASAFASQTSPDGERWAPLSEEYAARRTGSSALEGSGALRRSVTKVGGGSDAVRRYGKKFARVGTDVPYSLALQWGYGKRSFSSTRATAGLGKKTRSKGRRSDVPARRFIGWNEPMRILSAELMVDHLLELIAKQAAEGRA